jgi:hypothetical protein
MEEPPNCIEGILRQTGFEHVSKIRKFQMDLIMISALVERWRPETHTFHLPIGECTVTLEDVAVHLGLPINGMPLVSVESFEVDAICWELLGRVPRRRGEDDEEQGGEEDEEVRNERSTGRCVTNSFLSDIFSAPLPENFTAFDVEQRARAYIMKLIGGLLMPDKSSARTHLRYLPLLRDLNIVSQYSWGSGVLSLLYRSLDRACLYKTTELDGCLALLCSWAWYRMPFLTPPATPIHSYPLTTRYVWLSMLRYKVYSLYYC